MDVIWSEVDYQVSYGDLSISVEQWWGSRLVNIITFHTSETINGVEFPFKYRVHTVFYGSKVKL